MAHICDPSTGKSEAGELLASADYIVSYQSVKTIERSFLLLFCFFLFFFKRKKKKTIDIF